MDLTTRLGLDFEVCHSDWLRSRRQSDDLLCVSTLESIISGFQLTIQVDSPLRRKSYTARRPLSPSFDSRQPNSYSIKMLHTLG